MKSIYSYALFILNARIVSLFFIAACLFSMVISANQMLYAGENHKVLKPPIVTKLSEVAPPKVIRALPPQKVLAIDPLGHFTNFDTEQGLALSNITCVYVDKTGSLWFGTHGGGVSLYDGSEFKTITTRHGLIHNSVWAITEDSNGNIWFGTFGGGVTKYDGYKFTSYTTEDGLAHNTVWSILDDGKGNLWFGTYGGGASFYDGKEFITFDIENGLPNNVVWDITKDTNDNIWFATEEGVAIFDGEKFSHLTIEDGLPHSIIRAIVEDRMGNFWFGTFGGGVSYFDGENFTNYTEQDGLANNVIRAMMEDSSGNIWFATHGGGASMFNGRRFRNFNTDQGLSHNVLRSVAEDRSGNIWFGSDGGGTSRFNGKAVTIYTKSQGLAYNAVRHIAEDNQGKLWFGTNGGGLSVFDGKHFYNYSTDHGLPTNIIYSTYPLNENDAWIGTPEGVLYFDGYYFTHYTLKQGIASDRVFDIFQDSYGNIWFATANGLSKFDGAQFENYGVEQGLLHPVVRSMDEDNNGHVWFTTYGGGVSRYDGEKFHSYTTDDGLAHNWVRKVMKDSNGYLWFGTYGGGVSRYDGNTFVNFSSDHGLADNVVYDLVEDEDGIIWVGTNLGFSGLYFQSNKGVNYTAGLLDVKNKELQTDFTPIWEVYNNQTGYPIKDLNSNAMCITKTGLPYGTVLDKGLVWGGCGDDKVVCFNPKSITRETQTIEVVIKNIKINDESICWYSLRNVKRNHDDNQLSSSIIEQQQIMTYGKNLSFEEVERLKHYYSDIRFADIARFYPLPSNLELPFRHNQITFEYNAIETGRNFLVEYQYKLEGQDKYWRPVTKNNFVTFNNLREGRYTFLLKAKSPEGLWSDTISYSFRILPPWWRTWWMYSIYFLLIISAIYCFVKWRVHKLQKEKDILEKKVKQRTAELLCQKEEAERQRALVEEKNHEILEKNEEILQQKEELQVQSIELEKINFSLESRIAKELSESRKKDFLLIQKSRQAAMGEMIANIAHQWRQPLNAVGLIIQNIQEAYSFNELDEEYLYNKVKQSMDLVQYMSETINDFRDFFKPEKIATRFNVRKVVERSISFVEDTLKKYEIEIKVSLKEEVFAFGFPNEYAQVVLNLLNNSKDALVNNKPENPSIQISLSNSNGNSYLTIEDNGGGISDENIDKVFDPYFSTKSGEDGTGLGLYMSKTIIEKHDGGSLTFENTDDGVKFSVVL